MVGTSVLAPQNEVPLFPEKGWPSAEPQPTPSGSKVGTPGPGIAGGVRPFPLFVGERVELTFGMGPGAATFDDLRATLRCIASPKGTTFRVLHQESCGLREGQHPPGPDTYAEIAFDIQEAAWGTCFDRDPKVRWEVLIEGRTNRGKFKGRYLVPIYERPLRNRMEDPA